jgi:AraC-like DNA-binding protein
LPVPVNVRREGVDASAVPSGTFVKEVGDEVMVTGWHVHHAHQLEYAFEGVVEIETATARYLLPPLQAVWIPAGMEHCRTLTRVKSVAVYFDPALEIPAGDRVRILVATPVMREMILYARRWPITRTWSDATANAFFTALARLLSEWLDHEIPLSLPTASNPLVAAAIEYTTNHLAGVTLAEVCRATGASERTVRRAFVASIGMSWRRYLLESRLLRAMALLAADGDNVLAIALAVGFQSVSAFTRAFVQYAGETPSSYRRRVHASKYS